MGDVEAALRGIVRRRVRMALKALEEDEVTEATVHRIADRADLDPEVTAVALTELEGRILPETADSEGRESEQRGVV